MASVSYRDLIPEPVQIIEKEGAPFVINEQTRIIYSGNRPEWKCINGLIGAVFFRNGGASVICRRDEKVNGE